MANPLGEGGGDNPRVTSKFDRMHGHPRKAGKVGHPGGTAHPGEGHMKHEEHEPGFAHERHAPTKVTEHPHGKQHTYAHDHPAMSGLEHGARAKHPMHDGEQAGYENEHGYHGRGPMDVKK
jgi:hypothetical protein